MIEEKIKKYFLGELSEPEAELLERQVAEDENLFEPAEMVEDEIIDDYVRGDLSSSEKLLFESNYLTTKARYEKVNFARLFLNHIDNYAQEPAVDKEQPSFRQTVFSGFKLYKAFAFSGLAVLAMSVGFAIWLNLQSKPEIASLQDSDQLPVPPVERGIELTNSDTVNSNPKTNSNSVPKEINRPKSTPTPEIKPTPTPTPKPVEQTAPMPATFVLSAGTLRGEGEQSIKISKQTNKVNLKLNLPKDADKFQIYTATVKTAEGETVANFPNLKSLNLTLSANKLTNRTYIIFLEGKNAGKPAESVSEYTFRVTR